MRGLSGVVVVVVVVAVVVVVVEDVVVVGSVVDVVGHGLGGVVPTVFGGQVVAAAGAATAKPIATTPAAARTLVRFVIGR